MNTDSLIRDYLHHLTVERGLAKNSVLAYGRDLQKFARFLDGRARQAKQVRQGEINEFARRLSRDGLSPKSIARALNAVRMFYRFLVSEKIVGEDPTVAIRAPRTWKTLPRFLTLEEVDQVLGAIAAVAINSHKTHVGQGPSRTIWPLAKTVRGYLKRNWNMEGTDGELSLAG